MTNSKQTIWKKILVCDSLSEPGASITDNATQPETVQKKIPVCYASGSKQSLEPPALSRAEEEADNITSF